MSYYTDGLVNARDELLAATRQTVETLAALRRGDGMAS